MYCCHDKSKAKLFAGLADGIFSFQKSLLIWSVAFDEDGYQQGRPIPDMTPTFHYIKGLTRLDTSELWTADERE